MIRVFDSYGREVFISKESWRHQVLPGTLKSHWNDPEQLYSVIAGALNDGFIADVLSAAERLHEIDPDSVRAACVYGIVLTKLGRLEDAEHLLLGHINKHGQNGSVLTNLAKVYSARNQRQKAEETLWHGIELDPNQDNGMGWFVAIQRERGGETAGKEALKRIATLPGSWRAQLWLARDALQARRLDEALDLYRQCLAGVPKPVPPDLLMQMSGDLGNAGHLPELLSLTEPHFDVHAHGLHVGNNLVKAHIDLGQLESARRILDQLYSLNRMDWKQNLSFWDTEIAKARVALTHVDQKQPMQMAMLTIQGPVWLKPDSPSSELFPAKAIPFTRVAFLGSAAEIATNSKRIQHQMSDTAGRLSRALPLFLAEQIELSTQAQVQTLVPWVVSPTPGFVLGGVPWSDADAAGYARQTEPKSDYVVVCYLKTSSEPWVAELRLVRTIDAKCLGTLSGSFPSAKPEEGILALSSKLLSILVKEAEIEQALAPAFYQVPSPPHFAYYLLRLEQLLAVRCGAMKGVPPGFLSGEREIIDGNLQLCLEFPQNVVTRLLLAQTLQALQQVRPEVLSEFKEKVALLQKEKPLPQAAQGIVQGMLNGVFIERPII
ncbi:MAG TPA: hypothetical protein VFE51_20920 [Verrucomicrobiae bacterium]|nr:hypothetical protein [Verrucomicrobiae bacterium]